jgi:RNA polymerase sigma-70 factor (ECF subfamily)
MKRSFAWRHSSIGPRSSRGGRGGRTDRDDDREKFNRLWDEAFRRVLAYALRRTDPQGARDVTAETFLVAWRRIRDVPEEDEGVLWLLATARRVLANRRRAERTDHLMTSPGPYPSMPDHADGVAELQALSTAFSKLSERDREAIALSAWEGLKPREAARVLGTTAAGFSLRLHRARRRLTKLLRTVDVGEEERA